MTAWLLPALLVLAPAVGPRHVHVDHARGTRPIAATAVAFDPRFAAGELGPREAHFVGFAAATFKRIHAGEARREAAVRRRVGGHTLLAVPSTGGGACVLVDQSGGGCDPGWSVPLRAVWVGSGNVIAGLVPVNVAWVEVRTDHRAYRSRPVDGAFAITVREPYCHIRSLMTASSTLVVTQDVFPRGFRC